MHRLVIQWRSWAPGWRVGSRMGVYGVVLYCVPAVPSRHFSNRRGVMFNIGHEFRIRIFWSDPALCDLFRWAKKNGKKRPPFMSGNYKVFAHRVGGHIRASMLPADIRSCLISKYSLREMSGYNYINLNRVGGYFRSSTSPADTIISANGGERIQLTASTNEVEQRQKMKRKLSRMQKQKQSRRRKKQLLLRQKKKL